MTGASAKCTVCTSDITMLRTRTIFEALLPARLSPRAAPRRSTSRGGQRNALFHNFPLEKLRSGVGRSGVEKIYRLALVGWSPHLCVSSQCPMHCFCGESLTSRGGAQEVRGQTRGKIVYVTKWTRKQLNTFRDFPSAGLPPHVRGVAHALHAGHGAS